MLKNEFALNDKYISKSIFFLDLFINHEDDGHDMLKGSSED